ncbi:MAG: ChaN family lipoprotein [Bacteroidales bacterium]|nr:ChaN family lipoprotein [Bacteroidales bacterium]
MRRQLVILMAGLIFLSFSTDKPAYRIYNAKGKDVPYSKMLKTLNEADIILFGEHHDNPISHWLQRELTGDLYASRQDDLVLGAEMFESGNQLLIDEYFGGLITEAKFEDEVRLWNNYKTDYKPLLKFALDHEIPFIGTNVPRRYANLVYREGFVGLDSLSSEAKNFLPPLPVKYDPELPGYKKLLEIGHMGAGMVNENFPMAQAIKDATMGYFILLNWSPGKQFLHFNGSGHSDNYEGIVWYLRQDQPDLKIMTITTVLQESPEELMEASAGRADFTIVVPERMTRTY